MHCWEGKNRSMKEDKRILFWIVMLFSCTCRIQKDRGREGDNTSSFSVPFVPIHTPPLNQFSLFLPLLSSQTPITPKCDTGKYPSR